MVPIHVQFQHRLVSTHQFWQLDNNTLASLIPNAEGKVLFCLEQELAEGAYSFLPTAILAKASGDQERYKAVPNVLTLPGTETCKNSWEPTLLVCNAIEQYGIDRHSYVVAIGGGAFLDMVGFAAAIAHRGVRLIRIPTTVLAQADSGVGVKAAINAYGKKNFLGSFAVPWGVINDSSFLATLDQANKRAGLAEAIKVALIQDEPFFHWLYTHAKIALHDDRLLAELVHTSAQLHLRHIATGGDPFEQGSSRPLDFGHWLAHKLEAMTNFQILHGEAVAIGIRVDVHYSHAIGWLSTNERDQVEDLLQSLGYTWTVDHWGLEASATAAVLLEGINEFREHLGGQLTLLMLQGIGKGKEVHEVAHDKMMACLLALL